MLPNQKILGGDFSQSRPELTGGFSSGQRLGTVLPVYVFFEKFPLLFYRANLINGTFLMTENSSFKGSKFCFSFFGILRK